MINGTTINPDDLLTALRERNPQISSWLDRETGDIYQISAQFSDDEVEDDAGFAAAMQQTPQRFLRLPMLPAAVGFAAMQDFVAKVENTEAKAELLRALSRQRAFFHFQDVMVSWPLLQVQWQTLNRAKMLAWASQWLLQQDVTIGGLPTGEP